MSADSTGHHIQQSDLESRESIQIDSVFGRCLPQRYRSIGIYLAERYQTDAMSGAVEKKRYCVRQCFKVTPSQPGQAVLIGELCHMPRSPGLISNASPAA